MMFTLNGEILLDDSGSELAFKDFDTGDGKCRVRAGGPVRLSWSLVVEEQLEVASVPHSFLCQTPLNLSVEVLSLLLS